MIILKKLLFTLIALFICLDFAFSFTEPPYIHVNKPTPTAIKTVGPYGANYTTLEAADKAAQPGWLIKIYAGTYSPNTWNSSGTPGNEIVIEPYGDGDVIIDCNGSSRLRIEGSYIIFDGGINKNLIFEGTGFTDNYEKVIYPQKNSNHVTLSRLKVYGANKANCDGSGTNIQGYGDYLRIYNCEIYEACDEGIYVTDGDYIEIRNNIIYDNDGQGIQFNPHESGYQVKFAIISGNAIYNNGYRNWSTDTIRSGIGILSNNNYVTDIDIYNNMVWNNRRRGIKIGRASNLSVNIWANTIYNNGDGGVRIGNEGTHTTRNNICFGNGSSNWQTGSDWLSPDGTDLTMDPSFISTNQADIDFLKLSSSSSNAINQGYNLSSEFTIDYFNNPRPQGNYDIGAHEYVSGGPDTSPPNPLIWK